MKFDVAIVGAGPSGSWTAARLAARGARVALIDPSHPREKPCGGGVTGRALALVSGAVAVDSFAAVRIVRARFTDTARHRSADVPLAAPHGALVVASRRAFDGALLDAARRAGATIVSTRVLDLERNGPGYRLTTAQGSPIAADVVVGADGANSLVRRRLAAPFTRQQLSVATGFFAHGISSDEIVIELTQDPPGYIWSFPRPDHLAIGICAQADSGVPVEQLRSTLSAWIRRTGIAEGARLEPYSWPIPSLPAADFSRTAIAGPGWLTVGDAAGLVDPITREGIFFALQSAQFAVAALNGVGDPFTQYQQAVRDEIGAELARAARFKAGFFRPRFTRLLMDALGASPRVRAVMADLVAGTQGYKDLKWRLARTFELGLAWRWLRNH